MDKKTEINEKYMKDYSFYDGWRFGDKCIMVDRVSRYSLFIYAKISKRFLYGSQMTLGVTNICGAIDDEKLKFRSLSNSTINNWWIAETISYRTSRRYNKNSWKGCISRDLNVLDGKPSVYNIDKLVRDKKISLKEQQQLLEYLDSEDIEVVNMAIMMIKKLYYDN